MNEIILLYFALLSSWFLVTVSAMLLFLAKPWVGRQRVIEVLPEITNFKDVTRVSILQLLNFAKVNKTSQFLTAKLLNQSYQYQK